MELPPRFSSAGRQASTHAGSDTQLVDEHVNNGGTVGHMGLRKQLIKDCRLFKNYNNPDHKFVFPLMEFALQAFKGSSILLQTK